MGALDGYDYRPTPGQCSGEGKLADRLSPARRTPAQAARGVGEGAPLEPDGAPVGEQVRDEDGRVGDRGDDGRRGDPAPGQEHDEADERDHGAGDLARGGAE